MKAKRIYVPALSLFVTLCACFVFLFGCYFFFVTTTGLMPFGQQPAWMRAFSQFALLRTTIRLELAVATVGSALTLWLLLRTEAALTARLHLKNIVFGVVFAGVGGLLLGGFAMGVTFLQAFQAPGGLNRLGGIEALVGMALLGMAVAGLVFGAFTLIGLAVPYALFTLISRARQPSPAPPLATAQTPHNPPEYFHHTL